MAATLYSIDISSATTRIDGTEAALIAKGLITSTLYKDSDCLIFSTPLTTKVIKILLSNGRSHSIQMHYGDAWSSAEIITNPVTFCYVYGPNNNLLTSMSVIADSNYFLIFSQTGATAYYSVGYVGALDNGDVLVFGVSSFDDTGLANTGKNLTDGTSLYPVTFSPQGMKDASGNFYTLPLMWVNTSDNTAELNGAAPAGTVGVKVSSVISTGNNASFSGSGYILTPSAMYMTGKQVLYSALCFEYTA